MYALSFPHTDILIPTFYGFATAIPTLLYVFGKGFITLVYFALTQDLGVLLWSNAGKRLMVVTPSGHDEVRRFWRRQKNS